MKLVEVQVDRIVGPTHHFGGLGVGNVASQRSKGNESNPRAAALQGLEKMRLIANLGVPQLILPPQARPDYRFLKRLGFTGSGSDLLQQASSESPGILSAAMSSSAMWTANAATVSASVDGSLASIAMTIANLSSSLHRAIEPSQTQSDFWTAFPDEVQILDPIPGGAMMRDEGAANHLRLGSDEALPGIHVFVYGDQDPLPQKFWPRQTLSACQAIARCHQLPVENTFFVKQNPGAIDAGAFHNDVVAASHHGLILHHESAFWNAEQTLQEIEARYKEIYARDLLRVSVSEKSLSIQDAVSTYLFNSQIVTPARGGLPTIVCPTQVSEHEPAKSLVEQWIESGVFADVHYVELRQSMAGGGGPACTRLRVPMTEDELSRVDLPSTWSNRRDETLCKIIQDQYPESLCLADLVDADFISAAARATESIRQVLLSDRPTPSAL